MLKRTVVLIAVLVVVGGLFTVSSTAGEPDVAGQSPDVQHRRQAARHSAHAGNLHVRGGSAGKQSGHRSRHDP